MPIPPNILGILKESPFFALFVRRQLENNKASSVTEESVRDIIYKSPETTSKLPSDAKSQEALYKAVAAQIKITEKIKGKDSVSEDDLMQLLQEPFIQEVIRESGVNNEKVSEKISVFFKNLPNLVNCRNPLLRIFATASGQGEALQEGLSILEALSITNDELSALSNKQIPLSLLPKLLTAVENKNKCIIDTLQKKGIDLDLLELLSLLLRNSSFAAEPNPADSSEEVFPDSEQLPGLKPFEEPSEEPQPEALRADGDSSSRIDISQGASLAQELKELFSKMSEEEKAKIIGLAKILFDDEGNINRSNLAELPEPLQKIFEGCLDKEGKADLERVKQTIEIVMQAVVNSLVPEDFKQLPGPEEVCKLLQRALNSQTGEVDRDKLIEAIVQVQKDRETVEKAAEALRGGTSTQGENKSSGTTEPPKRTWVKWVVGGGLTALALIGGLVWWKTT